MIEEIMPRTRLASATPDMLVQRKSRLYKATIRTNL